MSPFLRLYKSGTVERSIELCLIVLTQRPKEICDRQSECALSEASAGGGFSRDTFNADRVWAVWLKREERPGWPLLFMGISKGINKL